MKTINFRRLLIGALVLGAGVFGIFSGILVSAQTDEVKAVTDVMMREAVAVE